MPAYNSVTIITSPYHAGLKDQRVGKGPQALLEGGLVDEMKLNLPRDVVIEVVEIEPVNEVPTKIEGDIGRSVAVLRHISNAVRKAKENNSFPLALVGNCMSVVGVNAGLNPVQEHQNETSHATREVVEPDEREIVWFDAHADLETPHSTTSGYLDGIGGCMLMGDCLANLLQSIPGYKIVKGAQLIGVGFRDISKFEEDTIRKNQIRTVRGGKTLDAGQYATAVMEVLADNTMQGKKRDAVLHFDVDVLDVSIGWANEFAVEGGLGKKDTFECMDAITDARTVRAMIIAGFNPGFDDWKKVVGLVVKVTASTVGKIVRA